LLVVILFLVKKGGQKNVFTDTEQQVDQMFTNGNREENNEV